jgi:hypothetical protein
VPNGGFSFDLKLKFDGTNVSTTRVQYQPPSLVRYFTPQRDFSASSAQPVQHAACWLCSAAAHMTQRLLGDERLRVSIKSTVGLICLCAVCMNVHCVPCGPKRCRVTYTLISATHSKSTRWGALWSSDASASNSSGDALEHALTFLDVAMCQK